jgi:peptide-methionine (S)-S-oxide reductase
MSIVDMMDIAKQTHMITKAGFGGGCHWCTEAVFASLAGVESVLQGWISPVSEDTSFSEAVLIEFDPSKIPYDALIAIHLYTHSCTVVHSMRHKYRSAIYTFSEEDSLKAQEAIEKLQPDFDKPVITQVLRFGDFKINRTESLNYYFSDPTYINPKLKLLLRQFAEFIDTGKLQRLQAFQS